MDCENKNRQSKDRRNMENSPRKSMLYEEKYVLDIKYEPKSDEEKLETPSASKRKKKCKSAKPARASVKAKGARPIESSPTNIKREKASPAKFEWSAEEPWAGPSTSAARTVATSAESGSADIEGVAGPSSLLGGVPSSAECAEYLQKWNQRHGEGEIWDALNHGSEEEVDGAASDEEYEPVSLVPRSLRMFVEPDEDTPHEALAANFVFDCDSALQGGEMQWPTSLYDFEWSAFPSSPIPPLLRREKFVENYGPTIGPTSNAYEAFVSIWDRPIMEHIAAQTNLYAQQYASDLLQKGKIGPYSRITFWRDTDVDELYVYFALLIAMGVFVKPKLEEYWTTDKNMFMTPHFAYNMTLKRFQLLSRCLHFTDNCSFPLSTLTRSQSKVFKVQPIVDYLNLKFSSLYQLGQNIALDESLTQWKGWLDIKRFIPNKAAATGIKTYEVCDSRTGYLWRFEAQAGAEPEAEQVLIAGAIPNLVLRLLRGLEHRGHTVWMNNYYNSPALARALKSLGYDCAGTLRTNRQFVPELIANFKNSDMTRGEVCGCTSGDVDLMVWRDQNRVAMISTYHGISMSGGEPDLIKDYNVCMGGVDKKDQMLSMFPVERKRTQIWYKKFFRRLLNVSILNAYILHKHSTPKIQHREFRMSLVAQLVQHHLQRPEPLLTIGEVPKFSAQMISHFPATLPVLPGGEKRSGKQRRQCVVCKTKRTHYVCNACNVALCFSDTTSCYLQYHS